MSAVWTLTYQGSNKTLAAWGISEARCAFRSLESDEFIFKVPRDNSAILTASTFAYGQAVTLYKDGVAWFIGKIRDLQTVIGTKDCEDVFTAANIFWELEHLVYQQQRTITDVNFQNPTLQWSSTVVFGQKTTIADLTAILNYALAPSSTGGAAVSFAFSIGLTGLSPVYEEAHDVTVAAAVRRVSSWVPDLASRCVYSAGVPVLYFYQRSGMGGTVVDLSAGTIEASEIRPRNDLKPDGVVFQFISSTLNAADNKRYFRQTVQTAGNPSGNNVLVASLCLAGDGGDNPEPIPATLAGDYYNTLSTPFYEGTLRFHSEDVPGTCRPAGVLSITGGHSEWSGFGAIIQEVTEDLFSGVTTVKFGPPASMGPVDFVNLNLRLQDAQKAPPEGSHGTLQPTTPGTKPNNPSSPHYNSDTLDLCAGGQVNVLTP